MTPSRVHLSNVDISAVYLSILNITLHKINQNTIVSLHRESMQSPQQREKLPVSGYCNFIVLLLLAFRFVSL